MNYFYYKGALDYNFIAYNRFIIIPCSIINIFNYLPLPAVVIRYIIVSTFIIGYKIFVYII